MNVVTHIELRVSGNRRSGIEKIHGRTNGNNWQFTEAQAIRMILGLDGSSYSFHVFGASKVPALVVVAGVWPHQFLKTDADGIGENNLLALPEWPFAA